MGPALPSLHTVLTGQHLPGSRPWCRPSLCDQCYGTSYPAASLWTEQTGLSAGVVASPGSRVLTLQLNTEQDRFQFTSARKGPQRTEFILLNFQNLSFSIFSGEWDPKLPKAGRLRASLQQASSCVRLKDVRVRHSQVFQRLAVQLRTLQGKARARPSPHCCERPQSVFHRESSPPVLDPL